MSVHPPIIDHSKNKVTSLLCSTGVHRADSTLAVILRVSEISNLRRTYSDRLCLAQETPRNPHALFFSFQSVLIHTFVPQWLEVSSVECRLPRTWRADKDDNLLDPRCFKQGYYNVSTERAVLCTDVDITDDSSSSLQPHPY